MYQFLSYDITLDGPDTGMGEVLESTLGCVRENGKFVKDLDDKHFRLELLVKELSQIISIIPEPGFTCEGVWDTSSSAGEYMDFKIIFENGELSVWTSPWYVCLYRDDYESYEDFEEECGGEPALTREEFDDWSNEEILYSLDSGAGPVVKTVPVDVDGSEYMA